MATSNEELLRALNFNANPTYRYVGLALRLGLGLGVWNESPFGLDVIVMQ